MNRFAHYFLILIAIVTYTVSAQTHIGRQKVDQFATSQWSTSTFALTWLPTDYNDNPTKSYPLIIFLHGMDETGTGINELGRLTSTALPQIIANGWNAEAVNPVDGQNHKFIVISPQHPTFSYSFPYLLYFLNEVKTKYRIDSSRIYITGLSAGGVGAWSAYTTGYDTAQIFAANVPVATAGLPQSSYDQVPLAGGTYKGKVWSICGTADSLYSASIEYTNRFNNANPAPLIPSVLTGIVGAGHSDQTWNTAYSPNWRNNQHNKNIYEWMLQYTRGSAPLPPSGPGTKIESENFVRMAGVQTEATTDTGGGLNVGWLDPGDYMDYLVDVPTTGTYNFKFRIASPTASGQFVVKNSAGAILETVDVPSTGGYQTWVTINQNVDLAAGVQELRIQVTQGGWNFNWWQFDQATVITPPSTLPMKIEAESYSSMSGIQTETTSDTGGGLNVGWINSGDWMDYLVNIPAAANYSLKFRIAGISSGQLQLRSSNGTVLATVEIPSTGGTQTWQTVTATANLPAGVQTLRIHATVASGGWNINWWQIESGTPPPTSGVNIKIEGEDYSSMSGIQTETTSDVGGGLNVGWIDSGDWMDYSVNIPAAANYSLKFRIAGVSSGQLQLRSSSGTVLATVNIPSTGGYQTWQTVTASANLPAGVQTLRIYASAANGGWNFNWWQIESATPPASGVNIKIEGESYTSMSGIQTEATSDVGGGLNVGWIDTGDWMDYSVNIPAAAIYNVNFRIAGVSSGQLQLRSSSGTVLATVNIPSTGGHQTWQTISASANLPAGLQTLRIYASVANGGWNFNWFEIISNESAPTANAGSDLTITLPVNSVLLAGSGSDSNGQTLTYAWSKVSGGSATIASPSSASTNVTGLVEGTYTFRLTVSNNSLSHSDDVTLIVNPSGATTEQITKVVVGEYFTGFITNTGKVKTALDNNGWYVQDLGLSDIVDGHGGQYHGVVRNSAGEVWTISPRVTEYQNQLVLKVAANSSGQPFTGASKVYGWYEANLALKNGNIYIWGKDIIIKNGGQTINYPLQLQQPTGKSIVSLCMAAMNELTLVALASDGTVWTYTKLSPAPVQVNLPSPATKIATIGAAAIIVETTNDLFAWGNLASYVGLSNPTTTPTSIKAKYTAAGAVLPAKELIGNYQALFLIDQNDNLFSVGDNVQGLLGNGKQKPVWRLNEPYSFAWTWANAQMLEGVQKIPGKFKNLQSGDTLALYTYIQDMGNNWYSWGRNKATSLGNGISLNGSDSSRYPDAINVPAPTLVTPLTVTWKFWKNATQWGPGTFDPSEPLPPLANAGVNQYLAAGIATTQLSGGGSSQQEGTITSYEWTRISGPNGAVISSPFQKDTNITGLTSGTYVFRLKVVNSYGNSDTSLVTVVRSN